VDGWPPIDVPELRARLALTDDAFVAMLARMTTQIGPREFTEELYAQALGYPWARPPRSFLLDGETVTLLDDLPDADGRRLLGDARRDRWPLLAFGSNGGPERLALKFAHLAAEQHRLLVLAGDLHDFDVGASAHPTFYGAMPGTIFPSPGTRVRAAVLWVTTEQLVALTWTEVSYALGRLDGVRFVPDLAGAPDVTGVFAFVSRLGAHRVAGETVALEAVPAVGRAAPAYSQERLLDGIAADTLGEGATARDLMRVLMEDFGGASATIAPRLRATAAPFASPRWTPLPHGAPRG
jgi:hypothetical protein